MEAKLTEDKPTGKTLAKNTAGGQAAKATVYDAEGKKLREVKLPEVLFGRPVNLPLVHQVVTAQLAAARQGTHKVKNRGEVSGSGRKPFRQKGTGNARQGSRRAPQMRGGGVVHGPTPSNYAQRTPKKMIRAALACCLSNRARAGRIHLVEGFGGRASTRDALVLFESLGLSRKTLVVLRGDEANARKSVHNIPGQHTLNVDQINCYDILRSDDVLFSAEAFETLLENRLAPLERKSK